LQHVRLLVQQSRVTQLEERHMEEKYMASKLQLQEKFILRRQLMMQRNSKVCCHCIFLRWLVVVAYFYYDLIVYEFNILMLI